MTIAFHPPVGVDIYSLCDWWMIKAKGFAAENEALRGHLQRIADGQYTEAGAEQTAKFALRPADKQGRGENPRLEFNEYCTCCARNKITVEVFGEQVHG